MNLFKFLLSITPQVVGAIIGIEAAVQAPGATKKQIVLNAISAATSAGEKIPEAHVAGISSLIDQIVGTLNRSGIFTTSSASKLASPQTVEVPSTETDGQVGTIGG